jgi:serpin B
MNPAVAVVALLLLCLLSVPPAGAVEPRPSVDAETLARSQNAFATDLYAQLCRWQGNLFFSPYSIASAMSMIFVGARGDTATEMVRALHLGILGSKDHDAIPALQVRVLDGYAKQREFLNAPRQEGLELHVANALWGKADYALNSEFVRGIKESFDGNLERVDFSNEAAACKRINGWVSDQTREKIRDLIGPGALTPDTRLVLTNAIYFKAAWQEQFQKGATRKETFHVSLGKDVDVDMMKQTRFLALAQLDGLRLLVIPYRNNEASMLVLLPDRVDGLAALEKSLTAEKLTSWVKKSQSVRVALSLPKFKNTSKFDLNNPLMALGMRKAFTAGQADFTGIAQVPAEPLYVGLVIHKAFVDVNEDGTEAAAATAVAMRAGSAMRPAEPVPFVADHPFVYIIRANRTGEILFMGRLSDPTEQGL